MLKKILNKMKMKTFYRQFICENDLCFDIGANIGNRTEIFIELGARVIAVEPQQECAAEIKRSIGNRKGVVVIEKALGAVEKWQEMFVCSISEASTLSSEFVDEFKDSNNRTYCKELVPVTTLDRLIVEYGKPVFCKIDVEGFETEVLRGLSEPIKYMSLEFIAPFMNKAVKCVEMLNDLGMPLFNYSPYESMQFGQAEWVDSAAMIRVLNEMPEQILAGDVYVKFMDI